MNKKPTHISSQFETYYHGTSSKNIESILNQGIKQNTPYNDIEERPTGVYVTQDLEMAKDYGDAIFEIKLDPRKVKYEVESSHDYYPYDIPPKKIKLHRG